MRSHLASTLRMVLVLILMTSWSPLGWAGEDSDKRIDRPGIVSCQITYEVLDGIYVDAGSESGFKDGRGGWILAQGVRIARFRCVSASSESAYLRLLSPRHERFPRVNDSLQIILDAVLEEEQEDDTGLDPWETLTQPPEQPEIESKSTLKESQEDEVFVPLLAPDLTDVGVTETSNVWHGSFRLRSQFQTTNDDLNDFQRTRIDTRGAVERLGGTAWSAEWDGDLSYRSGQGLENVPGHDNVRLELYRFAFSRRFADQSSLRFGRFIPRELPSIGTIDGFHGEKVLSPSFRAGAVIGFKPTREDLGLHFREPTVVPYLTYYAPEEDDSFYSGSFGFLTSMYEGDLDRAALLIDQVGRFGAWNYASSSELDFDVGAGESRGGIRTSRLDASVSYDFAGWTPRVGVDHFERPEIEAERDLIDEIVLEEADFFEDSYWRYWIGARHRLSENWSVDEEFSYTFAEIGEGFRWRASLIKRSLFGNKRATTTFSVFNILGDQQKGHGGTLAVQIPTLEDRLLLSPTLSVRFSEFEASGEDFEFISGSLRGHWRFSKRWSGTFGAAYSIADELHRGLLEIGVRMRF